MGQRQPCLYMRMFRCKGSNLPCLVLRKWILADWELVCANLARNEWLRLSVSSRSTHVTPSRANPTAGTGSLIFCHEKIPDPAIDTLFQPGG